MMTDEADQTDSNKIEVEAEEPVRRDLEIYDAFVLGANLVFLDAAGVHNYELGKVGEGGILAGIDRIQNTLNETQTATHIIEKIEDFRTKLLNQYEGEPRDTRIDGKYAEILSQNADKWREFVEEELREEKRINVPSDGVLDYEQLRTSPESMFKQNVWDSMDERPKLDFTEACKTASIGCSTAAVMLSLRAVEHYLREWHYQEVDDETESESMGALLDSLITNYTDEQDRKSPAIQQMSGVPSILSNIIYLKDKRNKVNHPDERPTDYEASITLFMVAGTISEIVNVLDMV